jgi:hypothetical protein
MFDKIRNEVHPEYRRLFTFTSGLRILKHGFEEDEEVKIEYTIVQRGRKRSILIICPICGKWGRLNVSKKTAYGRRFKIVHEKTKCSLSFTARGFTAVKRVHEKFSTCKLW